MNLRPTEVRNAYKCSSSVENRNHTMHCAELRPKTQSASALNSRIKTVKSQLQFLKQQVQRERTLLQEERMRTFYNTDTTRKDKDTYPSNYPANPSAVHPDQTTIRSGMTPNLPCFETVLSAPSKRHLKDIEEQCDVELTKLQGYIRNIGELKTHWKGLMMENSSNELGQFQSENQVNWRVKGYIDHRAGSRSVSYFNR